MSAVWKPPSRWRRRAVERWIWHYAQIVCDASHGKPCGNHHLVEPCYTHLAGARTIYRARKKATVQ